MLVVDDSAIVRQVLTSELGKTPGKDARAGKPTYTARFGVEGATREAERWVERAVSELGALPGDPSWLHGLSRYVLRRKG